jgi:1-acyl-sn-glycerol-3-phosphate acyltransferase
MRVTPWLRIALRLPLFVALLLVATMDGRLRHALGLVRCGEEGAVWIHGWCRRLVRALGIALTVRGEMPGLRAERGDGYEAVVCNHLSYLDILLLSAARPFVMVAKTEVRGWPLLGWLTAQAGTVYVTRGGVPETYPEVNTAMAAAYRSGLPVVFFPEGTTTDGSEVLEFRRGLFHSVLRDAVAVRTAAICYSLAEGDAQASVADDVCWWGDAAFAPHLVRFLGLRGVRAELRFGDVICGEDRFALAENGRAAVRAMYGAMCERSGVEALAAGGVASRQESVLVESL